MFTLVPYISVLFDVLCLKLKVVTFRTLILLVITLYLL